VNLATFAPGIFQLAGGQGIIVIANTATIAVPVGSIPGLQTRPAHPGEFLSIYATGLGPVTNQPPSGTLAPGNPRSLTTTTPSVTIGELPAPVRSSGLTPGFAGLYQVDVQVPLTVAGGNAVQVVLSIGGATSNTVTIAVQ